PFGVPPAKQGDYAYLLHIVRSLKSTGVGACILPHGVLFRGNAEADIRRTLIRKGYIKGIIGLPANLFYGTGIPACIVVINKRDAQARKGIFMIDASAGLAKDGPKSRLRDQDIHRIVDVFTRHADVPKYARLVPVDEIEHNDFNLNLPRYIDSSDPEDRQDIAGHLEGGIPVTDIDALAPYWDVCPGLKRALFKKNRSGYMDLKVSMTKIRTAIFGHAEFTRFVGKMRDVWDTWHKPTARKLKALKPTFVPGALINEVSEGLLEHYSDKPLIDPYDVYQHLMDYWADTMQDDAYLVAVDGWKAETYRIIEKQKNGKTKDKGWTCDLVPKSLIVARYFATQQAAIDALAAEQETVATQLSELEEEHGGEDGAFSELDKVNKGNVTARLKEIKGDPEAKPEATILRRWQKLNATETDLKRKIKDTEAELDALAYAKYPELAESEIKTLVVGDKWLATLDNTVRGEIDRVSQRLAQRIRELAERYAAPLPELTTRTRDLEDKVSEHLCKMGFAV
ncbi:MAG: N-6 DNA methylase, partial [Lentisphaerae bacterium]|nr:N-6 DNA methylase [Lentisphaerota bacterium]